MTNRAFPEPRELLKDLSEAFGPPGHEEDVKEYISDLIRPMTDDLFEDSLGNLIAVRKGGKKKLMLDAHTDEVGLMVRYIDDNGFLRFAPLGGWDDRLFAGHRVKLRSRDGGFYYGVIGMAPPHVLSEAQRKTSIKAEDYFIDIGAVSAGNAAELGAQVGDPGVLDYPVQQLTADLFLGKAFDDRAGCLLVVLLLKALADGEISTPLTVYANFATSEELGMRGAGPAAYEIDPDAALAVEGTVGADFPGVPPDKRPCSLRQGPVLSVIDKKILVPRKMSDFLVDCAKKAGVPYQIKMPIYGGTDAGAIHQARSGILSGVIAVPCRYIHSPNSTLYWPDLENTFLLLKEAVSRIDTII